MFGFMVKYIFFIVVKSNVFYYQENCLYINFFYMLELLLVLLSLGFLRFF